MQARYRRDTSGATCETALATTAVVTVAAGGAYVRGVRLGLLSKVLYCARHGYDLVVGFSPALRELSGGGGGGGLRTFGYGDGRGGLFATRRHRHVAWSKLPLLHRVLSSPSTEEDGRAAYDWVMASDADTLVTNPNVPLDAFLPPEGDGDGDGGGGGGGVISAVVARARATGHVNTGQFFLRASHNKSHTAWGAALLARAWARGEAETPFFPDLPVSTPDWSEQTLLADELLREAGPAGRVRVYDEAAEAAATEALLREARGSVADDGAPPSSFSGNFNAFVEYHRPGDLLVHFVRNAVSKGRARAAMEAWWRAHYTWDGAAWNSFRRRLGPEYQCAPA